MTWVNFYLYHTSERRIRFLGPSVTPVDIEPPDVQPFRIPFADMLELYHVDTPDDSTLDELETGKKGFWDTFFASPNYDEFDADQYCHSPWFEKCCGEKRSVAELKRGRDWDNIWFKMMPRKTVNYPAPSYPSGGATTWQFPTATGNAPGPTQIQVVHFDFDTLGIKLLTAPVYLSEWNVPDAVKDEIKVMLLLKV
jgi:hypothetical protein